MNREEIINEIKRRYLRNEPLTEKEVVLADPQFFHDILEEFGSWHKLEKEVGLLQRHLREREKYFLFMMMKERKERFGIEALRHKNIDDSIKIKIAEGFGTVKKLTKDILDGWNQERVLLEAHSYFITGGIPGKLKKDRSILYDNIKKYFTDEEHFYEEYEKKFLIQPLSEFPQWQETEETEDVSQGVSSTVTVGIDIETFVAVGLITEEEAQEVRVAASKPIEEILEFVSKLDPNVTDKQLAAENRVMWIAIKNTVGSLDVARKELANSIKMA